MKEKDSMWKKINLYAEGKEFIWSDNWWIDNDGIWFVSGDMNRLFFMDKSRNEAIYVSRIPSSNTQEFRKYPRCLRKDNIVFCFPDEGESIKCYSLEDFSWKSIHINNPDKVRLSCSNMWTVQDKLYIVSVGLKQVIEFNIDTLQIDEYYNIDAKGISGSVLVGNDIYMVDCLSNSVFKFNCLEKNDEKYLLSGIDDKIQTICFDGNNFWLSGRKKKLYIWQKEINKVGTIDSLPANFGMYNFNGMYQKLLDIQREAFETPLFLYSVMAYEYIWFIPFQTNEIIYVSKNTYEISIFPLEMEEQTEENIKEQLLGHKYLLEYVRENRYIGLFSLKNKWVFEIDAKNLTYKRMNYKLDGDSAFRVLQEIFRKVPIVYEKSDSDMKCFIKVLSSLSQNNNNFLQNTLKGKRIFENLKKDNTNFFDISNCD
jgi:hypothetical protein